MSVIVQCGSCRTRLKAGDHLAGKKVRCKCGTAVVIPVPEPSLAEPEIADLSGLIDGAAFSDTACPGCGQSLAAEAVICTACGFNKKTGQRMVVNVVRGEAAAAVEESASPKKAKTEKKPANRKKVDDGRPGLGAYIGKLVVIVIVLGGLGGAGWAIRGAIRHDPAQQAQDTLNKVYPGMTVEEVVKAAEGPPRDVITLKDPPANAQGFVGFPQEIHIGYADNFMKHHGKDKLKYGFTFIYRYTERSHLTIHFSEEGKVNGSEIVDPMKALNM